MGQTLTHGVYLPDEGERNCYSGLAANWQLLDGAVGTVAEHTTQIAGKAPAVHTHTKSDITDFPVYGTTAGTICEGNDSRLSDARTPLSHTHTKANITDLLNSNFIPGANNSYDLGSSSYQWNNLYAKNYYYNGVAWGLDKANVWTGDNTFNNNIKSKGLTLTNNGRIYTEVPSLTKGTLPSSTYYYSIQNDYAPDSSSASNRINQKRCYVKTDGTNAIEWNLSAWGTTNIAVLRLSIAADGFSKTYVIGADAIPDANDTYNLGNSTYKWKTLNGVNPGALSLPDCQVTQSIDRTGWVYDGATYNTVLLATTDTNMTKNGWLYVRMANTTSSDKLTIKYNSTADRYPTNTFGDAGGCIEAFVPVVAGTNIYVLATKDLSFCKFYPCLGNVPSGV